MCLQLFAWCVRKESLMLKLYSDSCDGQNRNRYLLEMLWFAMNKFKFTEIEHFFIKGHSKNETVDSVHATIERVKRQLDVSTASQWPGVSSAAKQLRQDYIVKKPDESRFFFFKQIASNLKLFT